MVLTLLSVLREVWCSLPLLSYLLGSLASSWCVSQTSSVAVKRRPKKTIEGSSESAAPSSVFDVFIAFRSVIGSRSVWLTDA